MATGTPRDISSDSDGEDEPGDAGGFSGSAVNQDGSAGVTVRADTGVSAPGLTRLAVEVIVGEIIFCALSAAPILVPVRLASGAR